ncbi:MAG: glycine/betaine ABC transporter substrate-binding protein, partial [Desulfuromonadales bacterium]|nr:glycine/betaine ABC transporter substrate-binding protein [Desulfuromonadales bacterium]NIS41548.1 glycine/betaine ABC transporter substrate-binding protein [Desulfuromonadales bacterium]
TESDNAVNMAAIADAIRKDKGRVFYCWRPSLVWIQFDILELEEPAYDPSCHNMISPAEDPEWYEKSKVSCASEERKVYIAWSKALEERLPVVTHLLGNIQLTAEMVSAWAYEIGGKNRDPGEVMKEWIAANKETVDKWLGM